MKSKQTRQLKNPSRVKQVGRRQKIREKIEKTPNQTTKARKSSGTSTLDKKSDGRKTPCRMNKVKASTQKEDCGKSGQKDSCSKSQKKSCSKCSVNNDVSKRKCKARSKSHPKTDNSDPALSPDTTASTSTHNSRYKTEDSIGDHSSSNLSGVKCPNINVSDAPNDSSLQDVTCEIDDYIVPHVEFTLEVESTNYDPQMDNSISDSQTECSTHKPPEPVESVATPKRKYTKRKNMSDSGLSMNPDKQSKDDKKHPGQPGKRKYNMTNRNKNKETKDKQQETQDHAPSSVTNRKGKSTKMKRKLSLEKGESPAIKRPKKEAIIKASSIAKINSASSSTPEKSDKVIHTTVVARGGLRSDGARTPVMSRRKLKEKLLLEDRTLGNHACILWSSEQRRRYQQENPDASSEVIDNLLRKHWDRLTDKEKLCYYQRAAKLTCKNRSAKTKKPRGFTRQDTQRRKSAAFQELSVEHQNTELMKKILSLQRVLPPAYFQHLIRDLRDNSTCLVCSCCLRANPLQTPESTHKPCQCSKSKTSESTSAVKVLTDITGARSHIWEKLGTEQDNVRSTCERDALWKFAQNNQHITLALTEASSTQLNNHNDTDDDLKHIIEILEEVPHHRSKQERSSLQSAYCQCDYKDEEVARIEQDLKKAGYLDIKLENEVVQVPCMMPSDPQRALLAEAITSQELQLLSSASVETFFSAATMDSSYVNCAPIELSLGKDAPSLKSIYLMQNEVDYLKDCAGLSSCCSIQRPSCILSGMVLFDNVK